MPMPSKVKNKYNYSSPSPPVVSTNCSSLKSLYRSFRSQFSCSDPSSHRYLPINPTSSASRQVALQLEHELAKLDELLRIDQEKLEEYGINHFSNVMGSGIFEDKVMSSGGKFSERKEMLKLADGGYLRFLGGNHAMQISAPALISVEIGSSFSQVINRMASMGRDNLIKWLVKSMPICDLSKTENRIDSRDVTAACSEEGVLEALLIEGVEKLETLALEGLKTQMCMVKNEKATRSKKKVEFDVGYGLMEVMLIQMIDPTKGYEHVGETMIGFIEASFGKRDETCLKIDEIHVAGTGSERNKCGYMWSVSTRNLDERSWRRSSDMILRNPDIALAS